MLKHLSKYIVAYVIAIQAILFMIFDDEPIPLWVVMSLSAAPFSVEQLYKKTLSPEERKTYEKQEEKRKWMRVGSMVLVGVMAFYIIRLFLF